MKKMNKTSRKLFKRDMVLFGIMVVGLFVMALSVFAAMFVLQPGYIGVGQQSLPLARVKGAEAELRKTYYVPLTSCHNDNRTMADRIANFNNYLSINKSGDRAILRGCNDIDQVYARRDNGRWVPLFTINADMAQDNTVRQACGIEDITVGETDTRAENQSANTIKVATCKNFLTNVSY